MKSANFVSLYGNPQQDTDIETMGALEFVSPLVEALVDAGVPHASVDAAMVNGYGVIATGNPQSVASCLTGYIMPVVAGLGKAPAVDALNALAAAFNAGSEDPALLASLLGAVCNSIAA